MQSGIHGMRLDYLARAYTPQEHGVRDKWNSFRDSSLLQNLGCRLKLTLIHKVVKMVRAIDRLLYSDLTPIEGALSCAPPRRVDRVEVLVRKNTVRECCVIQATPREAFLG